MQQQQFGAPASNDFGNFQSSEAAKPAVDKKVAGLIDMDDLLGSKKTETTSGGAGKGTPMNAMKPMGATKMGPGSSSGFGAAGGFGASPMMPMSGAPSMGMGASAPMGGMGQTMMNPQMGGMGMVSLAIFPFALCCFFSSTPACRLACCSSRSLSGRSWAWEAA
jgi:hypothetical protein